MRAFEPGLVVLIQEVRPDIKMTDADCDVAIGAMHTAAEDASS
jgi:hypothetical protein